MTISVISSFLIFQIPEYSISKISAKAADYIGKIQNNTKFLEFAKHIDCIEERFAIYLKYNFIEEAFTLKWPKG